MNTKQILFAILTLSMITTMGIAYAEEDSKTMFGTSLVVVALAITIIGIALRTIIGMSGKPRSEFNPQLLLVSIIVGFFASIQLVIVTLQQIPADANELLLLSIVTSAIATVMGIDAGVKSAAKRVQAKINKPQVLLDEDSDLVSSIPAEVT